MLLSRPCQMVPCELEPSRNDSPRHCSPESWLASLQSSLTMSKMQDFESFRVCLRAGYGWEKHR